MAKQSAYLKRIKAKQELDIVRRENFVTQYAQDAAVLALAREFHFGPERMRRFNLAFCKMLSEFSERVIADKDDKEVAYFKATVDRELKAACGQYYAEWDVRYGIKKPDSEYLGGAPVTDAIRKRDEKKNG